MPRIPGVAPCGLFLLLVAAAATAQSREVTTRTYETARFDGEAPRLDGHLDDRAWDAVAWSGDFVQRQPEDGTPPTAQTRFKVVYDDRALYFAFRCHDDPALITRRLARRDWFPGDWVEVNIDSRADNRTAYSFTFSVSGTRGDEYVSEDGNSWDGNWDPVWEGAAQIDQEGWTAEIRIPLSQIRFDPANERPWGLQVQRRIYREEERSTWQEIPRDANGWVSNFGELRGIDDLQPPRRAELLPYVVAQTERYPAEADNPFRTGHDDRLAAGLDAKLGLGSDFSLDLTINPDFGQVEADPSKVNLTEFETFFTEKRPFFIEGQDILELRLAPAMTGGHYTRDLLFYSRRIGRRPHYDPEPYLDDDEYADAPDQTSILGAAKLTGKTAGGLSVGVLESVTARESADISGPDGDRRETVEPLTNYFVGRVTQDLRRGDTVAGAMLTSTVRRIEDDHLRYLSRQAWAGGADLQHYFLDRDWRLNVRLLASHLRGDSEAILEAQTASARYFQRPDNDEADVDSTATTLNGHAGSVMLTRTGNGSNVQGQLSLAWRSPGFEINDLGFMRRADEINNSGWLSYVRRTPFSVFNHWRLNGNYWLDWDTGGTQLRRSVNVNTNGEFRSGDGFYLSASHTGETISNTVLRGGPSSLWPRSWEVSGNVYTDHRRPVRLHLGAWYERFDDDHGEDWELWSTISWQPSNRLRLSASPSYGRHLTAMQYVTTADDADEDRYVFGSIDQHTFELTLRVDLSLTANLTVQYYGSPFVSAGAYSEFKRITDPRADRYDDRFDIYDDGQIARGNDGYEVDENRDGTTDYTFDDPAFNVRDFNSNLVIRWEYRLGSTLYFVWSQGRSDVVNDGTFDLENDLDALFGTDAENVFLVKANMWISL